MKKSFYALLASLVFVPFTLTSCGKKNNISYLVNNEITNFEIKETSNTANVAHTLEALLYSYDYYKTSDNFAEYKTTNLSVSFESDVKELFDDYVEERDYDINLKLSLNDSDIFYGTGTSYLDFTLTSLETNDVLDKEYKDYLFDMYKDNQYLYLIGSTGYNNITVDVNRYTDSLNFTDIVPLLNYYNFGIEGLFDVYSDYNYYDLLTLVSYYTISISSVDSTSVALQFYLNPTEFFNLFGVSCQPKINNFGIDGIAVKLKINTTNYKIVELYLDSGKFSNCLSSFEDSGTVLDYYDEFDINLDIKYKYSDDEVKQITDDLKDKCTYSPNLLDLF